MIPVHLQVIESTAKGRVFKAVTCEDCQVEFVYLLSRQAEGYATTVLGWDMEGTSECATARARAELQRLLARDQDPVPCPTCGWYQQAMIPLVRAAHRGWMRFVGGLLLYLGVILVALAGLSQFSKERAHRAMAASVLEAAAGLAGIGCGLILVRKFLAGRLQPNEIDREKRLERGHQRARTRSEFDRLLAAAGDGSIETKSSDAK